MKTKSLAGVPMATNNELEQTMGGVAEIMQAIMMDSVPLDLTLREMGVFCRNTPGGKKGKELWEEFVSRRTAKPEGQYKFTDFMLEVLAEAGYPVDPPQSYERCSSRACWNDQ